MTVLEEVLLEEYERILRTEALIKKELEQLPRGYISIKKINGRNYHYLQFRQDSKVKSQYIKAAEVDAVRKGLASRKKDMEALASLEKSKKAIIRALGRKVIDEHTTN